LEKLMNKYKQ